MTRFPDNRDVQVAVGYARVSTDDPKLDGQPDAPRAEGYEHVFKGTTGGAGDRPALRNAFEQFRASDTLVVWRLDRLGCSLKHLIERVKSLRNRGVGLPAPPAGVIRARQSVGQRFNVHLSGRA